MGPVKAIRTFQLLVFSVMALGATATAQEPLLPPADAGDDPPAHIALVEGAAILERDGEVDDSPMNMPLLAGDRVRTRAGRVEILFADGSTLHLDHNTVVDLQSDELVRLIDGRIRLSIPGPSRDVQYRVDGPQGWLTITEPGDYRVAMMNGPRGNELEVAVLRGRAALENEGGQTVLRAGERAFARAGAAPSYAYVANSAAWDAFDRWSEARRDERLRATATYVPDEVRPYAATLEQYGEWRSEPTYGAVWYPRVEPDWRPYYRGRWVSLRPYGWTWVAYDPWGWPTHHYGRWGHSGSSWFWIPGRRWGAAWVSWAYADDYVSWCPLGWNNRPVFALNININIGRGYDPWRAWTVLPRRHFGVGYVHRNVIRPDYLDRRTRGAFVARDRGPDWGSRAVPRSSAPIRAAGTRDGRRGNSPVYSNVPGSRSRVAPDGQRVQVPGAREPLNNPGARNARIPDNYTRPGGDESRRAVPRERTTPDGPAVRSQRSPSTGRAEAPARTDTPGRYEAPGYRNRTGGDTPRQDPATDPRPADRPSYGERPRSAVPRSGSPRDTRVDPPASNDSPAYGRAPRGGYSRPPADGGYSRPPADSGYRRAPNDDRRTAPADRGAGDEPRRPSGITRPRGDGGPARSAPGSYDRRPSERSAPPARADQPSRGGRDSGPAGARPRGGGQSGGSARPRGGG